MNRRIILLLVPLVLLSPLLRLASSMLVFADPKTIRVPDDYPTIQATINAASDGDTIQVAAGTYYENIIVNKTLSLIGENKNTTIIYGNKTKHAVEVASNNVVVSGFTITNGRHGLQVSASNIEIDNNIVFENEYGGIHLGSDSDNNTIVRNLISYNNGSGVFLSYRCDNNVIKDNEIHHNRAWVEGAGIEIKVSVRQTSLDNIIEGNYIHNNRLPGIRIKGGGVERGYHSQMRTVIKNNTITENHGGGILSPRAGIRISWSSENIIEENKISKNEFGIILELGSFINIVSGNEISGNSNSGIQLSIETGRNEIKSNFISSNGNNGIEIDWGFENTIESNVVTNNGGYGIFIEEPLFGWEVSKDNVIFNNYFDNSHNAFDPIEFNKWNTSKTSGNNIVSGPYLGGNYWSDYYGEDEDGDGIGDVPYAIPGGSNVDYLPLKKPPAPQPKILSVTFDKTDVNYRDWVTITVKARNDGGKADEMYISVSLPDNPPIDNIQMVSHDLQDAYILPVGAEVWGDYGTTFPIVLEYPLVEGFKEYWETGETKTLQFKVKPQNPGTFRFFVKTTAQVNGEWSYDPQSGTKDKQNEYVYVYIVSVRSSMAETALTLETPPLIVLAYNTVVFTGQLIQQDEGYGISDALIQIYEKDLLSEELLAEGRTDQQGRFTISWSATPMDFDPLMIPIYIDKTVEVQAKFAGLSEFDPSASDVHEMTIEPIDVYTDHGGQGLEEADGSYTRSDTVRLRVARFDFDVDYPNPLRQYLIEVFDPSDRSVFYQKLDGDDESSIDGWVFVEIGFPLTQEMPLGTYKVEVEYVLVASGGLPPIGSIYQIGKDVTSFTVTERFEVDVNGETFNVDLITNSEIVSVQPLVDSTRTILELSGSDGTTGWLNLTVNKSMVTSLGGNKDTIQVLIDGNPSNFTVSEIDEHYVITVNYTHSIRVIEVLYTTPSFYSTTLILIAFVVVAVTVSFIAYFLRRKRLRRNPIS